MVDINDIKDQEVTKKASKHFGAVYALRVFLVGELQENTVFDPVTQTHMSIAQVQGNFF